MTHYFDIQEELDGRTITVKEGSRTSHVVHLFHIEPVGDTARIRHQDVTIIIPDGDYLTVILERATHAVIDGCGFTFTGQREHGNVASVTVPHVVLDLVVEAIERATRKDPFDPVPHIRQMFAPRGAQ